MGGSAASRGRTPARSNDIGPGEHLAHRRADADRAAIRPVDGNAEPERGDALRGVRLIAADGNDDERQPEPQRLLRAVEAAVGHEEVAALEDAELRHERFEAHVGRRVPESRRILVTADRRHRVHRLSPERHHDRLHEAGLGVHHRSQAREDEGTRPGSREPGRRDLVRALGVVVTDVVDRVGDGVVSVPRRRGEGELQIAEDHVVLRVRREPEPGPMDRHRLRQARATGVVRRPRAAGDAGVRQPDLLRHERGRLLPGFAYEKVRLPRLDVCSRSGISRCGARSPKRCVARSRGGPDRERWRAGE